MGSETSLWNYIRPKLGLYGHLQRHEDKFSSGIPDTSYGIDRVNGWIELKHVHKWPARSETPVKVGMRDEQRDWLSERGSMAGRCYILVQVGRDYLLFGHESAFLLDALSQSQMYEHCIAYWHGSIDFVQLKRLLV